jgi:hypothetical protein
MDGAAAEHRCHRNRASRPDPRAAG